MTFELYHSSENCKLYCGDSWEVMQQALQPNSVDLCITSPPYYPAQRDYKLGPEQLGWEAHPYEYIDKLVGKYSFGVKRVLKPTGSYFVNIGDTYNGDKKGNTNGLAEQHSSIGGTKAGFTESQIQLEKRKVEGIHEKSLLAIPQLFEVEMIYKSGWCMRNQQLWIKPNAIPKTAPDRWGVDYEVIPFFVKQPFGYYFKTQYEPLESDAQDLLNPSTFGGPNKRESYGSRTYSGKTWMPNKEKKKIARSILFINTNSREGGEHKHVAPFPTELVEAIIDAACPPGGTVLDIFAGSCSAGEAALKTGRRFVGIDLNREFLQEALDKRLYKYTKQERLFF